MSQTEKLKYCTTAVPNLFGARDWFCGRQFFHPLEWWGWCREDSSALHSSLPPAVLPGSQQAADWYQSAAGTLGTPAVWYCLYVKTKKKLNLPWLVWLSGLSTGLWTKGSWVWFPVIVHAWAVGQVCSMGHVRGNHTLMFLSLSFSFPSPLSKNK